MDLLACVYTLKFHQQMKRKEEEEGNDNDDDDDREHQSTESYAKLIKRRKTDRDKFCRC